MALIAHIGLRVNLKIKKLFQNGIEEFFTDFWNVDSDLEIYLSKLK